MTKHDLNLLLAHSAISDKKSWLNEKWDNEKAIAIARAAEAEIANMQQ